MTDSEQAAIDAFDEIGDPRLSELAVEWPEIGSRWTRITDSATADGITVSLPARIETLIVDAVDPKDPQGRQIQGRWFSGVASARYSASHVIFWASWEPMS